MEPARVENRYPDNAGIVVSVVLALVGLHSAVTGRAAPKGVFVEGMHVRVVGVALCLIGLVLLFRALRKK